MDLPDAAIQAAADAAWLPDVREYWPDGYCTRCSEPHADDRRGLCDACMLPGETEIYVKPPVIRSVTVTDR